MRPNEWDGRKKTGGQGRPPHLEQQGVEAGELGPLEAGEDLLHLLPRIRPVQRQLAQYLGAGCLYQ